MSVLGAAQNPFCDNLSCLLWAYYLCACRVMWSHLPASQWDPTAWRATDHKESTISLWLREALTRCTPRQNALFLNCLRIFAHTLGCHIPVHGHVLGLISESVHIHMPAHNRSGSDTQAIDRTARATHEPLTHSGFNLRSRTLKLLCGVTGLKFVHA